MWTGALLLGLVLVAFVGARARGVLRYALQLVAAFLMVELGLAAWSEEPVEDVPIAWRSLSLDIEGFGTVRVPKTLLGLPTAPDGDALEVLYIGDSFTAGQGVVPGEAFPDVVHAALVAQGHEVQTFNHGVAGTSFWEQLAILDHVSAAIAPDLVVWTWLLNDLGASLDGHEERLYDDGVVDRLPAQQDLSHLVRAFRAAQLSRRQTAAMIETYRALHDPSRNGPVLDKVEESLRARVAQVKARGGRFLFVVHPLLFRLDDYPFVAAHRELVARAQRAGAEVLDLWPMFEGRDASTLWATRRDHHPNTEGYRIAGEAVAQAILAQPLANAVRACGPDPDVLSFETLADYRCHHPEDVRAPLFMARGWAEEEEIPGTPFNQSLLAAIGLAQATALAKDDAARLMVAEAMRELGPKLSR